MVLSYDGLSRRLLHPLHHNLDVLAKLPGEDRERTRSKYHGNQDKDGEEEEGEGNHHGAKNVLRPFAFALGSIEPVASDFAAFLVAPIPPLLPRVLAVPAVLLPFLLLEEKFSSNDGLSMWDIIDPIIFVRATNARVEPRSIGMLSAAAQRARVAFAGPIRVFPGFAFVAVV